MITSLLFNPTEKCIYGVRDDLNQIFRYKPGEDTLSFSSTNSGLSHANCILRVDRVFYVGDNNRIWRYHGNNQWSSAVPLIPDSSVLCLTYDNDREIIYGGTSDGRLFIGRYPGAVPPIDLGKPGASVSAIYSLSYAQDLKKVIIGTGEKGELFTWDIHTWTFRSQGTILPGETRITSLVYSFRRGETFGGTYPNAKLFSFVIGTPLPTKPCLNVAYDKTLQQLSQCLTSNSLVRSVKVKSNPLKLKIKHRVWLRDKNVKVSPRQTHVDTISLGDPCLDDVTGDNSMDLYLAYYTDEADVAGSQHSGILLQDGDILNDGTEDLIKVTWKRRPTKPYLKLENIGTKPFWTLTDGKGLYLEAVPFQAESVVEGSADWGDKDGADVTINNDLIQDKVTAADIAAQMMVKNGMAKSYIQELSTASTILSPLQINDRITVKELVCDINSDYRVKSFAHDLSVSDESVSVSTVLKNLEKIL